MSVVMKYAGEFMDLGDKSQYMDEFIRRVKSVVTVAELELGGKMLFFSRPMPEDITPRDLYMKLCDLLDAIYLVKSKLTGDYLVVAANIGFISRLDSLQSSVEDAKVHVRLELPH